MRIIIGRIVGQGGKVGSKIRVPEFHKNGKKNKKFDYYMAWVKHPNNKEIKGYYDKKGGFFIANTCLKVVNI